MAFPYNIHICSSSLSENFWQLIFSSLPLCIFKRTLGGLRFPPEVQTSGQGQNSEGWSNRGKTWKKGRLEWERTLLLSVHFTHSPPHFTHRCRVTTSPCWSYKNPVLQPTPTRVQQTVWDWFTLRYRLDFLQQAFCRASRAYYWCMSVRRWD